MRLCEVMKGYVRFRSYLIALLFLVSFVSVTGSFFYTKYEFPTKIPHTEISVMTSSCGSVDDNLPYHFYQYSNSLVREKLKP